MYGAGEPGRCRLGRGWQRLWAGRRTDKAGRLAGRQACRQACRRGGSRVGQGARAAWVSRVARGRAGGSAERASWRCRGCSFTTPSAPAGHWPLWAPGRLLGALADDPARPVQPPRKTRLHDAGRSTLDAQRSTPNAQQSTGGCSAAVSAAGRDSTISWSLSRCSTAPPVKPHVGQGPAATRTLPSRPSTLLSLDHTHTHTLTHSHTHTIHDTNHNPIPHAPCRHRHRHLTAPTPSPQHRSPHVCSSPVAAPLKRPDTWVWPAPIPGCNAAETAASTDTHGPDDEIAT